MCPSHVQTHTIQISYTKFLINIISSDSTSSPRSHQDAPLSAIFNNDMTLEEELMTKECCTTSYLPVLSSPWLQLQQGCNKSTTLINQLTVNVLEGYSKLPKVTPYECSSLVIPVNGH